MDVKFGLAPGTSAAEHAAAVANGGELVDRAVVIVRPMTREPDTASQEGATPICSSDDNAAAQRDEVRAFTLRSHSQGGQSVVGV